MPSTANREDRESTSAAAFGFLSVIDLGAAGYCGGLLILDARGRPLEFHCSLPLCPNHTQRILYGPTLHCHLRVDKIGRALVEKTAGRVRVILTDEADLLDVREWASCPVGCVVAGELEETSAPGGAAAAVGGAGPHFATWNNHQVRLRSQSDGQPLFHALTQFGRHTDLREPFQRIREALLEAQAATPEA
jgi:hypothetical protein